jgi:hypothetical protein
MRSRYEALAVHADGARLPEAQALRRGADRRARVVTVAACVVAALLLGGVSVAARPFFAVAPSVGTSVGTTPPGPIPDSAFFVLPPDMVVRNEPSPFDESPTEPPPDNSLCGEPIPAQGQALYQRSRIWQFRHRQTGDTDGAVVQGIIVFGDGGASATLAEMRTALANGCTQQSGDPPVGITYRLLDDETWADESVSVEITTTDGSVGLVRLFRIGDVLVGVTLMGDEPATVDPATLDFFTELAEAAVRTWL